MLTQIINYFKKAEDVLKSTKDRHGIEILNTGFFFTLVTVITIDILKVIFCNFFQIESFALLSVFLDTILMMLFITSIYIIIIYKFSQEEDKKNLIVNFPRTFIYCPLMKIKKSKIKHN